MDGNWGESFLFIYFLQSNIVLSLHMEMFQLELFSKLWARLSALAFNLKFVKLANLIVFLVAVLEEKNFTLPGGS